MQAALVKLRFAFWAGSALFTPVGGVPGAEGSPRAFWGSQAESKRKGKGDPAKDPARPAALTRSLATQQVCKDGSWSPEPSRSPG